MSLLQPQVVGIIAISSDPAPLAPCEGPIDSLLASLVELRHATPATVKEEPQVIVARGKWSRAAQPGADVTIGADLDELRSELLAEYQRLRR
ncbi:hypothetical protein Psta_4416 [Pirellula staleyi DSM 6068]|uniref:Uncharacterized protein n=1 Tax=Pirellula staleyi (strain ATCC 27377 / DSM 6068 / ICPB 4128) TaxID=530564 RepID=D2R5X7_PIRSD|nr:hypothetical protein [Pirellula staleyi]ADB19062.1 hypothetical protein Psta_4416 [Pirellula staleyi DSM 6068]